MRLEEAIKHAEEMAKCGGQCGEEHAQLAEWLKELQRMRTAQTDSKKSSFTHKALDTISRQAAINIERNATVDTNPSHFEAHQKFTQFMDDAEISSFGRWQWSNGFNTALTAVEIDLKKLPSAEPEKRTEERTETHACDCISRQAALDCVSNSLVAWEAYEAIEALPAAQPEIIRCGDCKHWIPYDWMFSEIWRSQNINDYSEDEIGCEYCDMAMKANDFCSRAERRTDENNNE